MSLLSEENRRISGAKPFLKWAGGKTQLIKSISESLPKDIKIFDTYIEPFVGSGAVMFWILKRYPNIQQVIINDKNKELINVYRNVKESPIELISVLDEIQSEYYSSEGEDAKKECFLQKRILFNEDESLDELIKAALFIFLNKTCFNGLYRVNSKNCFNVPFGRYLKPTICDKETIMFDSELLQKAIILNTDYSQVEKYLSANSFVYLDPPYKPLSKTSSFNSYNFESFDDAEQIRLCEFCKLLDSKKVKWLLSNSDPQNTDAENSFFDDLYRDFNISRVDARRSINSDASKRGKIKEILIKNYI